MGWTRYFATGVTRDPLVKTREFAAYDVHSSVIRGFTHALTDRPRPTSKYIAFFVTCRAAGSKTIGEVHLCTK